MSRPKWSWSSDEIEEYRGKIAQAKLPEQTREKLNKELGRLAKQSYSSSESTVLRNYLDICLVARSWISWSRVRISTSRSSRRKSFSSRRMGRTSSRTACLSLLRMGMFWAI